MKEIRIPGVYYHSVGIKKPDWVRKSLTLEIAYFEKQVKYFAKNFNTVSLKEYWEARNGLKTLPKNSLLISFDDGLLDNYVWAFPYLKKYNLKATIFVNPEFVDQSKELRPMANPDLPVEKQAKDLQNWGYLNWNEMREMEKSGLIDIQSHTLTHTKYFVSDKLVGFNRPGADVLYPIGNLFPEEKPYYITNNAFGNLVPYGYPFFEEASAMIANRVWINNDFNKEVIAALKNHPWNGKESLQAAMQIVEPIHSSYKTKGNLIIKRETDAEYENRVVNEISGSKKIIEQELNKKVEFVCWPHGDTNLFAHKTALEAGILATTLGKQAGEYSVKDRIDVRIPTGAYRNNPYLSLHRMLLNVRFYQKKFPYYQIKKAYFAISS